MFINYISMFIPNKIRKLIGLDYITFTGYKNKQFVRRWKSGQWDYFVDNRQDGTTTGGIAEWRFLKQE